MHIEISDNDLEYRNEYDPMVEVYYKGAPFTGIVKDSQEYCEYKDGRANGTYVVYFNDGQISVKSYYENGSEVYEMRFYENGLIKSERIAEPASYKVWNLEGKLVKENNILYHKNGQIKTVYGKKDSDVFLIKTFSKNGSLMFTVWDDWEGAQLVRHVDYDHEVMFESYYGSLFKEFPELADEHGIEDDHYTWMWFWKVFELDGHKYIKIANSLLEHPVPAVRSSIASIIAWHKLNDHIILENEHNAETWQLIREYTARDNAKNPHREVKKLELPE